MTHHTVTGRAAAAPAGSLDSGVWSGPWERAGEGRRSRSACVRERPWGDRAVGCSSQRATRHLLLVAGTALLPALPFLSPWRGSVCMPYLSTLKVRARGQPAGAPAPCRELDPPREQAAAWGGVGLELRADALLVQLPPALRAPSRTCPAAAEPWVLVQVVVLE